MQVMKFSQNILELSYLSSVNYYQVLENLYANILRRFLYG